MITRCFEDEKCPICDRIVIQKLNSFNPNHYYRWFSDKAGRWLYFCGRRCRRKYLTLLESE